VPVLTVEDESRIEAPARRGLPPTRSVVRKLLPWIGLGFAIHVALPHVGRAGATLDALAAARWGWLLPMVAVSAFTYLMAAVALIGATQSRLDLGRTWAVQVAAAFTNRLAPAGLGGMATNMRYLRWAGDDRGGAATAIGLNSLAGFVVHAIGFSDKNELRGKFVDTSLDNFLMTMNISVYSFVAVAQRAARMMQPGGSILTLSYYGAEKVIPHYNVMGVAKAALETSVKYLAADLGPDGIRVNAISAGPIKTLAASGIGDFRYIMKWNEYNSPLRRNVTIEDVGGAGLYLLSDLASGVTGEIHHVDAGYNVIGMKAEDAPDISTV